MSKLRVGLLSLILLVQGLTIVGGFMAYHQMSERYTNLRLSFESVLREDCARLPPEVLGGEIDWGPDPPNPFLPVLLLALFGAFLTIVLLVDEVRQK